jgi:hypothetical protein
MSDGVDNLHQIGHGAHSPRSEAKPLGVLDICGKSVRVET